MRPGPSAPIRLRVGPGIEGVALAMLLALLSVAPVALRLQEAPELVFPGSTLGRIDWHPIGTEQALALAAGSVLPAGLLGGVAATWVRSRRPLAAPAAALTVAWLVGIVALPMVASALQIPLRDGIACFDACDALLDSRHPFSGLAAYGETVLFSVLAASFVIVPIALFALARWRKLPILFVVAGISAHAVVHVLAVQRALAVYTVLVVGVLLWAGYLWARDRRVGPFGRPSHRAAIVAGTALLTLAVAAPALGSSWVPTVPTEPVHAFAGRINIAAAVGQNPSGQGGVEFVWLPAGSGCLDAVPISRGQVTVCWSADVERRPTRDSDQFHFRIELTYEGPPPAPSWLMAEIRLVDEEGSVVARWPDGVVEGGCREAEVESMTGLDDLAGGPGNGAREVVCGRTTSMGLPDRPGHRVIWTCVACRDAGAPRPLVVHESIAGRPYSDLALEVRIAGG